MHDDALRELLRRADANTQRTPRPVSSRQLIVRLRRRRTVQLGGVGAGLVTLILVVLAFKSSREMPRITSPESPRAIAVSDSGIDELIAEKTLSVYAKLEREKLLKHHQQIPPEQAIEQLRSQAAITMLKYGDSLTDKANEPKLAAEMYRRTNELFPGTRGAEDARTRLARMGS